MLFDSICSRIQSIQSGFYFTQVAKADNSIDIINPNNLQDKGKRREMIFRWTRPKNPMPGTDERIFDNEDWTFWSRF